MLDDMQFRGGLDVIKAKTKENRKLSSEIKENQKIIKRTNIGRKHTSTYRNQN
jgi:hypothetical protein